MREDPANFAGSTFWGEALKGRSEGSWRSGRRRSGDVGGGGTVNVVSCIPCRAGYPLSTSRARTLPIAYFQVPIGRFPV
jgi:hypothetical protein